MNSVQFDIEVILRQHIIGGGELIEHIARKLAEYVVEHTRAVSASENNKLVDQVAQLKRDRQMFKEASFPFRMSEVGLGPAGLGPAGMVKDYGVNPTREQLAADGFDPDSASYRAALATFETPKVEFTDRIVFQLAGQNGPTLELIRAADQRIQVYAELVEPRPPNLPPNLVCIVLPANCYIDPNWPHG